jgi:hypothetical protein
VDVHQDNFAPYLFQRPNVAPVAAPCGAAQPKRLNHGDSAARSTPYRRGERIGQSGRVNIELRDCPTTMSILPARRPYAFREFCLS